MEATDTLKGVLRREKDFWLYLQIIICYPTCEVELQCLETPGMFVGVVGCDIRAENPPSRPRTETNEFAVVISELTVYIGRCSKVCFMLLSHRGPGVQMARWENQALRAPR